MATTTTGTQTDSAGSHGTQTDSAGKSKKKGGGSKNTIPGPMYDPSSALRRASVVKHRAAGVTDPLVIVELGNVEAGEALLIAAATDVAIRKRKLAAAESEWEPCSEKLKAALAPVIALARVAPGGRNLVRSSISDYVWVTSGRLLERVTEDDLGIPAEFIGTLRTTHDQAIPARANVDAATADLDRATGEYMVAKGQFIQATRVLSNAVKGSALKSADVPAPRPKHHRKPKAATDPANIQHVNGKVQEVNGAAH